MLLTEEIIKAAAVAGIALIWVDLTREAFKFTWHMIHSWPEKNTFDAVSKAVCEECHERFHDDGNKQENGRFLCKNCRVGGEKSLFK